RGGSLAGTACSGVRSGSDWWSKVMAKQLVALRDLYKSVATVSEHHDFDVLKMLHVATPVDNFVAQEAVEGRVILLTGNPGDGKTHLIRVAEKRLTKENVTCILDANRRTDEELADDIEKALGKKKTGLVMAINEGTLVELLNGAARSRSWA